MFRLWGKMMKENRMRGIEEDLQFLLKMGSAAR